MRHREPQRELPPVELTDYKLWVRGPGVAAFSDSDDPAELRCAEHGLTEAEHSDQPNLERP